MPFVLVIGERSNSSAGRPPAVKLYRSREDAQVGLAEYVRSNWKDEVGDELPEDTENEELIEHYFDEVLEFYDIQEVQEQQSSARSTDGPV